MKTRKLSIKIKIMLVTGIMMTLLTLLLGVNFYARLEEDMVAMGVRQAETSAAIAVHMVDAKQIAL